MKSMRLILALTALMAVGCGAKRKTAYLGEQAAAAAADDSLEAQARAAWDGREDKAQLEQALVHYEALAAQHPDNRAYMETLSRGYYLLGVGHAQTEEEVLAAYDAGASWGERILGLSDGFRTCVEGGKKDYECLGSTTKEDVPGIYWAYANQGKWAVAKGFTTVLKHKNKLKAFIDKVHELDRDYYYGAADRGLAAFYAKAPSFAGGDLDLAKKHFDASLERAPDYLGTKVLMAEYYAAKTQDAALFDKLLGEVAAGDATKLPDIVPIQKLEQANGKKLLAQKEDLFE